jgi:hypothetical protein
MPRSTTIDFLCPAPADGIETVTAASVADATAER